MKIFALILFILTYVLMIALPKYRPWVAVTSAVIFLVAGIVPVQSLGSAIDFNVLMMLAGTMGTVSLFIESRMPNRMAEMLLQESPNVMWVVVVIMTVSPRRWYSFPRAAIRLLLPPPPTIAVTWEFSRTKDDIAEWCSIFIPPLRFSPIYCSKNNTRHLKSQLISVIIRILRKDKGGSP